jgi:hypothetical protein
MSQLCATQKCERTVRGLCDCCKQQLCLQHLNKHNLSLINQLIAARVAKQQETVVQIQSKMMKFIPEQETTQRERLLCVQNRSVNR